MEGAGILEFGALGAGDVLDDAFGVWGIFCINSAGVGICAT